VPVYYRLRLSPSDLPLAHQCFDQLDDGRSDLGLFEPTFDLLRPPLLAALLLSLIIWEQFVRNCVDDALVLPKPTVVQYVAAKRQ
jgi:hypothetical protein